MLTERGPQTNSLETKCTADTLILHILQPTPLAGRQFGTGEYGKLSFNDVRSYLTT